MAQQAGEELKSIFKKPHYQIVVSAASLLQSHLHQPEGKGLFASKIRSSLSLHTPYFNIWKQHCFAVMHFVSFPFSFPGSNLPKRTVVPRRLQSSILGANSPYTWVKDWGAVGIFLQQLFSSGNPREGLKLCMNGGYTRQFLAKKRLGKVKKNPTRCSVWLM